MSSLGRRSVPFYVPVFEPSELEEAELVRMRVYGFCGSAFGTWSQRLWLPPGTLVMDKREMGKQDIARTHAWNEFVISERLREVFHAQDLTGWVAEPIQHIDPKRDRFGPLYRLQASSVLPPLAPETELELRRYGEEDDVLGGTTALFERGPLCYRRSELTSLADVNKHPRSLSGGDSGAPVLYLLTAGTAGIVEAPGQRRLHMGTRVDPRIA